MPKQPIIIILNLNSKQIHELLSRFKHCWHAFIIADAYNEHALWSYYLIEQFIYSNILNPLQKILTSSDNNYSNLFTSIDSPYFLDIIRVA
ncbi:unnamed protein product [Adineta steineri]|uniref:Spatacsin C-terminal domain-containing protein n=1 Tax=Adineta steineri TaxID=433720 RepID=A0A819UPT0_9BILA|nr:unnamed protein product [Adineta steineri]